MRKKIAQACILVTLSGVTVQSVAADLRSQALLKERILSEVTAAFATIEIKLSQIIETTKEDALFLAGTAAYSYREIHDEITAVALLRQEAVARLPAVALAEKFGRVVGILGTLDSQRTRQLTGQILRGGRNHPLTERKSSRLDGEGR